MSTDRINQGFAVDFKMYMEGISVPFTSTNVISTPNGNEATINIHSTEAAFNLKPKISVQVFYREWWTSGKWRLFYDGFFSRIDKTDSATDGAGMAITCRDFSMDIRKAPASIAFGGVDGADMLATTTLFTAGGLYQSIVLPSVKTAGEIRIWDHTGLSDLDFMVKLIAGTAQQVGDNDYMAKSKADIDAMAAKAAAAKKAGEAPVAVKAPEAEAKNAKGVGKATEESKDKKETPKEVAYNFQTEFQTADGEAFYYLDAFIRGLWIEAIGGTMVSQFMGKRIRVDKRIVTLRNRQGYKFFAKQGTGNSIGQYIMGNSRFASIESVIMRVSALFMCRTYSCSTPFVVDLSDPNQRKYFTSPKVYKSLIDSPGDMFGFGAKMMIAEKMIFPPLEFTAPPNCNVMFPCMYNNVVWQQDDDADITRGSFTVTDSLTNQEASTVFTCSVKVPALLIDGEAHFMKKGVEDKQLKEWAATAPSLTLEERYKGVNSITGSVSYDMALNDLTQNVIPYLYDANTADEIRSAITKSSSGLDKAQGGAAIDEKFLAESGADSTVIKLAAVGAKASEAKAAAVKAAIALAQKDTNSAELLGTTHSVLQRHAVIKFLNQKFAGRTAEITMQFNPFILAGFPGVLIADNRSGGARTRKSIIGTVQQVQHVTHSQGYMQTVVVMNNCRYIDEPTSMSLGGLPTFLPPTITPMAEIDLDMDYVIGNTRSVDDGDYAPSEKAKAELQAAGYSKDKKGTYFIITQDDKPKYEFTKMDHVSIKGGIDLKIKEVNSNCIYAKDFTSVSAMNMKQGQSNVSFLDSEYLPNRITKFYKEALGQGPDHLMVGKFTNLDGKPSRFMYDSIHEAVDNLERCRPELLEDYRKAMGFCRRSVCSEQEFMFGIIGASYPKVENVDGIVKTVFKRPETVKEMNEVSDEIGTYYGVTDDEHATMIKNKWDCAKPNGTLPKPGSISSITEHCPVTAWTSERRDSVMAYKASISVGARAARYASDK